MNTTLPYFTIGHSNRSLEEFIGILAEAGIGLVADVRKMPMSRSNPQFNKDALSEALAASKVSYEHMAALGGLRGKSRDVVPDVNGLWTNDSFHNYADYALSPQFHTGLAHLVEEGREGRCAIMCSEAVWWRCHRRIIADYLIAGGETVFHLMGPNRVEPARLTPGARVQAGAVVYPASDAAS
ncbi:MAG TPA: DUF488 domain-containing protein [Rhizomicrobium sp.]|nr:DUF488 domain-containing protein [Rhizomicrobium sp.]